MVAGSRGSALGSEPGKQGERRDGSTRAVGRFAQHVEKIFLKFDAETMVGFENGRDRGEDRTSFFAAEVQPVFASDNNQSDSFPGS